MACYFDGLFNFFIKRDLRRAALFLWITPLDAARSSSLIARFTASAPSADSPCTAEFAFLTAVRTLERTSVLRARLRADERIRLIADRVLATLPPESRCQHELKRKQCYRHLGVLSNSEGV